MNPVSAQLVKWTVPEQLERAAKTREEWDQQFDQNVDQLAREIAADIKSSASEELKHRLSPYLPPMKSETFEFFSYLRFSNLKSNLPPFNQFSEFIKSSYNPGELDSSFYFKKKIEILGSKIESHFKQCPRNESLEIQATWDANTQCITSITKIKRDAQSDTQTTFPLVTQREGIRKNWDENFVKNLSEGAEKIGNSIAADIFNSYARVLSNPIFSVASRPFDYRLNFRDNSKHLEKLTQSQNPLPLPFSEWIHYFAQANHPLGDHDYFSDKEIRLTQAVRPIIERHLTAFKNQPGNEGVDFQIFPLSHEMPNAIKGRITYSSPEPKQG